MTTQPEALRLAQELDAYHTRSCHKEAAAELRRLHQFAEDQIGRATAAEAALQMTKATHALKIAAVEAQRDAMQERAEYWKRKHDDEETGAERYALRAQRDALLEALQEALEVCIWPNAQVSGVEEKARAALAQPAPEPETCTWHQDGDSDSGTYSTSCRHYFNLDDGTPEDNKMSWCCYCGKRLAQELITENSDD